MRYRYMLGPVALVVAILGGRAIVMAQRPIPSAVGFHPNTQENPNSDPQRWRARGQIQADPLPMAKPPAIEAIVPKDDPMGEVESFLTRSRKEADDSIKALTLEAENLRARLQKVDAALARWQGLSGALNNQEVRPEAVLSPATEPQLEAIKPPPELPVAKEAELPTAAPVRSPEPNTLPPSLPDAPR